MASPLVLHLAIPARDEAARLPAALAALQPALAATGITHRVEVVDDASRPDQRVAMARLIEARRATWPELAPLYSLPGHAGKGGAIRASWDRALAAAPAPAWLGLVDADGAVPAADVARLVGAAAAASPRCDAWLAARVADRWSRRRAGGAVFARWAQAWLRLPLRDPQAPGKIVAAAAYAAVRDQLREVGWAFDVELLARLRYHGAVFREIEVGWTDVPGGHVRPWRDGLGLLRAVWRIRRRGGARGQKRAA